MKRILALLFLTACQDYNSNSSDRFRYGSLELENNPEFRASYAILQNRCINCHTSSVHSGWSTLTTSQKWIDSGRVINGDAQNSILIERIINSGHTNSDMPLGSGALANDEYDTLVEWIDNL
jgi:uncharacterized membrane protein